MPCLPHRTVILLVSGNHDFGLPIDDIIYNGMPSTISEIDCARTSFTT